MNFTSEMANCDESIKNAVMDQLDKLRLRSSCRNLHVAVLFTNSNRIIDIGVNKHNTTYKTPLHDTVTIHAEMDVINQYMKGMTKRKLDKFKRKRLKIAVFKITRGGQFSQSQPCNDCLHKLHQCGIHRIHWSIDANSMGCGRPKNILDTYTNLLTTSGNRKSFDIVF